MYFVPSVTFTLAFFTHCFLIHPATITILFPIFPSLIPPHPLHPITLCPFPIFPFPSTPVDACLSFRTVIPPYCTSTSPRDLSTLCLPRAQHPTTLAGYIPPVLYLPRQTSTQQHFFLQGWSLQAAFLPTCSQSIIFLQPCRSLFHFASLVSLYNIF